MQHLEKLLKALANEKRLKILELLKGRRVLNVGEIAKMLDIPLNTVSRHLRILEAVDIVSHTRKRTEIYYKLSKYHNAVIRNVMSIL